MSMCRIFKYSSKKPLSSLASCFFWTKIDRVLNNCTTTVPIDCLFIQPLFISIPNKNLPLTVIIVRQQERKIFNKYSLFCK